MSSTLCLSEPLQKCVPLPLLRNLMRLKACIRLHCMHE